VERAVRPTNQTPPPAGHRLLATIRGPLIPLPLVLVEVELKLTYQKVYHQLIGLNNMNFMSLTKLPMRFNLPFSIFIHRAQRFLGAHINVHRTSIIVLYCTLLHGR